MAHTRGPFEVGETEAKNNHVYGYTVYTEQGEIAALEDVDFPAHVQKDNAHLFAAAPELLKCCEDFCEFVDTSADILGVENFYDEFKAAIKKARGK